MKGSLIEELLGESVTGSMKGAARGVAENTGTAPVWQSLKRAAQTGYGLLNKGGQLIEGAIDKATPVLKLPFVNAVDYLTGSNLSGPVVEQGAKAWAPNPPVAPTVPLQLQTLIDKVSSSRGGVVPKPTTIPASPYAAMPTGGVFDTMTPEQRENLRQGNILANGPLAKGDKEDPVDWLKRVRDSGGNVTAALGIMQRDGYTIRPKTGGGVVKKNPKNNVVASAPVVPAPAPAEVIAPAAKPVGFFDRPENNPDQVDVYQGGKGWTNKSEWHGGVGMERGLAQENLRMAIISGNADRIEKAANTMKTIETGLGEREKTPTIRPESEAGIAKTTAETREKNAKAATEEASLKWIGPKTKAEVNELNARAAAHGTTAKRLAFDIKQADTHGIFKDPVKAATFLANLGMETVVTEDLDTGEKRTIRQPNAAVGVKFMKDMGLEHLLPKGIKTEVPKEEMTALPSAALHKGRVVVGSDGKRLKSDGKAWIPVR